MSWQKRIYKPFDKEILIKTLVNTGCVIYGEFKLSSGKSTNYYYDLRTELLRQYGTLNYLVGIFVPEMEHEFGNICSVGGPAVSSIPIMTALVCWCAATITWPILTGFYVRKDVKEHGMQKKIEGVVTSPCVIVDDVLTTGASVMEAVDAVKAEGHEIKGVMTIIDREDEESIPLKEAMKCYSLLKHSDFQKEEEKK